MPPTTHLRLATPLLTPDMTVELPSAVSAHDLPQKEKKSKKSKKDKHAEPDAAGVGGVYVHGLPHSVIMLICAYRR